MSLKFHSQYLDSVVMFSRSYLRSELVLFSLRLDYSWWTRISSHDSSMLEVFTTHNCQLSITDHLNIHLEDPCSLTQSVSTISFSSLVCLSTTQSQQCPTYDLGGWLDVVITTDDSVLRSRCEGLEPSFLLDHGLLLLTASYLHAQPVYAVRSIKAGTT